jgi:transcription initiation factor TFIIIB Brf1 subunit/transcription initiation factor TFIIB
VDKYAVARWYRRIGFSDPESGESNEGDGIKVAISRICNGLAVTEKAKRRALLILERLRAGGLAPGRNHASVAAGIVYFACIIEAENVSANDVAAKAGVGRDALFRTLKDIRRRRTIEALLS